MLKQGGDMKSEKIKKYLSAIAQPQSNYALDNFVDGGQLTTERRFRQSLMELEAAINSHEEGVYQQAKRGIKLRKKELKLSNMPIGNTLGIELLKLEINRIKRVIESNRRSITGIGREIEKHKKNLDKYEAELGLTGEETEDQIYTFLQDAEAEHYVIKLALDTAAHMISKNGGPTSGVMLALQQLPPEDLSRFRGVMTALMNNMMSDTYTEALHGTQGLQALVDKATKTLEDK